MYQFTYDSNSALSARYQTFCYLLLNFHEIPTFAPYTDAPTSPAFAHLGRLKTVEKCSH